MTEKFIMPVMTKVSKNIIFYFDFCLNVLIFIFKSSNFEISKRFQFVKNQESILLSISKILLINLTCHQCEIYCYQTHLKNSTCNLYSELFPLTIALLD